MPSETGMPSQFERRDTEEKSDVALIPRGEYEALLRAISEKDALIITLKGLIVAREGGSAADHGSGRGESMSGMTHCCVEHAKDFHGAEVAPCPTRVFDAGGRELKYVLALNVVTGLVCQFKLGADGRPYADKNDNVLREYVYHPAPLRLERCI